MRAAVASWQRNWQKFAALLAGLLLITLHVIRNDVAALAAGTFLVTLGLFIDRLAELTVGAIKAKFIQEVAEKRARLGVEREPEALPAETEATVPVTGAKVPLMVRPAAPRSLASAPFTPDPAWMSIGEVAQARTADELVRALANWAGTGRNLSPERRAVEQEAMAAIMDLQAERARASYLGEDTPDERTAADQIVAFWSHPEAMTDVDVRGLVRLIRSLIDKDQQSGIGS